MARVPVAPRPGSGSGYGGSVEEGVGVPAYEQELPAFWQFVMFDLPPVTLFALDLFAAGTHEVHALFPKLCSVIGHTP